MGRKLRLQSNWRRLSEGTFEYDGGVQHSPILPAYGLIQVRTGGTWDGTLDLQLSRDDGQSWQTVESRSGLHGNSNYIIEMRCGSLVY